MKKFSKRLTAFALALLILTHAGQTASASWAIGSELVDRTVTLAPGTRLTTQSLWSASKSDLRTEHYITYTSGGEVVPVIYSGTYVASTNTVTAAASQLEAQGYRVAAAVNGGFFNSDGTIVGMLMTGGIIRSLDVVNYAMVGFTADGSVFIDESWPARSAAWQTKDGLAYSAPLWGFNAFRHADYLGGLYLYNRDFSSRVLRTGDCVWAVLRPAEGKHVTMNGELVLEVESVADTAAGDEFTGVIPEGCYMLYAEDHDNAPLLDQLRALTPEQQITVSVSGVSEQWSEAVYGVSALYTLLREGEIVSGLPAAANPYTALGVREDGTVIFYTIDGRQSGYSVGATYAQVAQRLQELGCVTAVALDGGASTTLGATLPGSSSFGVVNRPSSAGRRLNNTILLVTPNSAPTGAAAGFYLTSPTQVVIAGGELTISAQAYDTAGCPLSGPIPEWTATGGSIAGDGLTALYTAGAEPGTYVVSPSEGDADALHIRVVDTLSRLRITRSGSSAAANTLELETEEAVELSATGTWWNLPVAMDNSDVAWTADPAIGTINELGRFTAGSENAAGIITASAGGRIVTIYVTVKKPCPFVDVEGHWSADYVTRLFDLGITKGYSQPDGTYLYKPSGQLSRGELLVFISRMLGVDTALYQDVELPFADAPDIDGWMLADVRAMYALGVLQGNGRDGALYADVKDSVTREAAMTMLGRVLAETKTCDLTGFDDGEQVSPWANSYVQTLVAIGVVEGNGNRLRPQDYIDRAAAAKLLVSVYELEKAPLLPRGDLTG